MYHNQPQGWRGSFFLLYISSWKPVIYYLVLCVGKAYVKQQKTAKKRGKMHQEIESRQASDPDLQCIFYFCAEYSMGFVQRRTFFFFLFLPFSGLSADPYEVSHTQRYMLFQHEAYSTFERSYFRNDVICVYMVRVGKVRRRRKNYIYIHIKTWGFHWVEMPYKHIIVSKTEDLVKLENQR